MFGFMNKSIKGDWVKLEQMACPAAGCLSKTPVNWVCAKDSMSVFVNEYGKIKCAESSTSKGTHIANICEWSWKCSNITYHKGEYIKADFEGFNFALSEALKFSDKQSSKWISKLVLSLGEQYKK
ncbi:uncharacterized protein LOC127840328 [Dreissena polymorpha]|uniref:uncharacterized protein LOC127840328 n=1 Tax=Dreissena polymorpha TaxID=45954 RepID=UPI0022641E16|nr:uncharacterized protein LOC127840328 [Dreissena polymorpha]